MEISLKVMMLQDCYPPIVLGRINENSPPKDNGWKYLLIIFSKKTNLDQNTQNFGDYEIMNTSNIKLEPTTLNTRYVGVLLKD